MRALAIAATGMDAQQTNLEVIANNIANINTPNYRPQQVLFEEELRETMQEARPRVVTLNQRVDINNEMCTLSKNTIMYNALASKISSIFGLYKWVIENSGK